MPNARQAVLAGVLNRISEFSVDSFHDRLRLQKTVYLLQAFGIYLGYSFNWYLYGPYSAALTRDAYEVVPTLKRWPRDPRFANREIENIFERFLEFLSPGKADPKWLELVASLHMLSHLHGKQKKKAIFRKMAQKQPYLTDENRRTAWEHLERSGLI